MSYSLSNMNAVGVDTTPSLLYNNLSTDGERVTYIHKDRVVLFNEAAVDGKVDTGCEALPIKGVSQVTHAKWVYSGKTSFLVVCSSQGIQVYDSTAKRMLFFDPTCERIDVPAGRAAYVRGATINQRTGELIVGTSTGQIAVFTVEGEKMAASSELLENHTAAICSIESDDSHWVSGADDGSVTVWNLKNEVVATIKGNGFPATSVGVRGDVVVIGSASGSVNFYRISTGATAVSVAAHARCVTAIAVHPSLPLVATVGEDTALNVFTIPDFSSRSSSEVEVAFTTTVTDRLLTGVQFSQGSGKAHILVAAYDSHSISCWLS